MEAAGERCGAGHVACGRECDVKWWRRDDGEEDLERELRSHLEAEMSDQQEQGLSAEEARYAARRAFGNQALVREEIREMWSSGSIERLLQDIRFSVRTLRKSRGFTIFAVLALALGLGANAAIFSVVDAVLLRSLPFKNADHLVDLTEYKTGGVDSGGVPFPDYLVWRDHNTVFEETAAYSLINASNDIVLGGPFSTERERYSTVTNSFFTILGVHPAVGRGFSAPDEIPGGEKIFLVSDAVWHSVFGGDPHALYRTYLLDGEN